MLMKNLILTGFFLSSLALPVMAQEPVYKTFPATVAQPSQSSLQEKTALVEAKEAFEKHPNSSETRATYARQLLKEENYKEALTHYLWCYDNATAYEPDYEAVRISFLIAHISDFGGKYKPAIDALAERRDKAQENLLNNQASDSEQLRGVILMNRALNNGAEKNLALFDALKKDKRTNLVGLMANYLQEDLLAAKRYSDIIENAGDISKKLALRMAASQTFIHTRVNAENNQPKKLMVAPFEFLKTGTINYAGQYFTALLGVNDIDQARKIAQQIIDFDPTPQTFALLIRKAHEFDAKDLTKDLAEQAKEVLIEKN